MLKRRLCGQASFRLIAQRLRAPGAGVKVRFKPQRYQSGALLLMIMTCTVSAVVAAGAIDVLVAVPYDDLVPCPIREKMFEALSRLECGSGSKFNLHLGLVDDWEPTLPQDLGRRAAIARLRNHLLDMYLQPEQYASFLQTYLRRIR